MITFIHIGKCGGTTIKRTLIDNAVKFRHIHLKRPEHEPDSKYLIALRNPVERFISAFYWRRFLLLSGQEAGGKELEFYKEYKDLMKSSTKYYNYPNWKIKTNLVNELTKIFDKY